MNDPTPGQEAAAEYAALVAMRAGLDAVIDAAKARALDAAKGMRSGSWATPYGRVNVTTTEPRIVLDDPAFLAMVSEHYPDEVILTPSVSPAFRAAFLDRLVEVGGRVVHKDTGEVVECAGLTKRGNPQVSYPASTEQRDAKALAVMLFEERATALVASLREVTA